MVHWRRFKVGIRQRSDWVDEKTPYENTDGDGRKVWVRVLVVS